MGVIHCSKPNWRYLLAGVLGWAVLGCGSGSPEPTDTGATAAVSAFHDALLRKDWPAAYAMLHADSRNQWSVEQFAQRCEQHRKNMQFEPTEFRIRSCEETGNDAIAHVLWLGRDAAKQRSFRDGVSLRRSGSSWAIVLSPRFGEPLANAGK